MKTGRKFITALALFSIFAQSAILPLSKTLVYAQEITATPTEAFSPTPLISPTTEITSSVSPALTPEASLTPQVTPTQDILDGVSTIAPTEESTPQPQPTEEPKNNSPPTQGDEHIEAIVLSNVSAPSLDLSTQESAGSASVSTDKADYAPTDTALITGSGFNPGETYLLYITSSDEPAVNFKTEVKADENGSFAYAYQLDGNYRPNYKVEVKDSSGNVVVLTTFTDSDSGFVAPNQTIASSSVSNPDNGWLSDDNRATFNNSNDTSDYGFPELGIPAGATIDGIEVTIEAQRSGNRDLAASLWNISNNNPDAYTNDKTATLSGSDSVQTLGGPTDKWGETWTVSDFSDADFKIRIGATGGNNEALLDQVRVKVYYTEEAPVCTAPPSGMTSWWPADGNTDDIVGTNNGTAENGATFASGKVDQAFSFDGTNDLVAASNVGDFGSDPFTVDFWMKSNNDGSSNPTFIVGKNHADDGLGWDIRLSNSTIRVYGVNGWSLNIASDASATPNVWHHIALASTGTTVNLYIDGVLKGTSPRSAITSTSNPFRIGFTTNFQSPAFNGLIDEVEIFNRALSLSEIQAIYNADSAGKCKEDSSPTPNWPTSWTTPAQCSTDPVNDENPSRIDLIGDGSNPAVGFSSDSNYRYFRERVGGDPSGPGGFGQNAWVVLFQTSTPKYQYLGSLNGKDDKVQLYANSTVGADVDFNPLFNDPAEDIIWEGDAASYARIVSDGGVYFADWAIPVSEFSTTGITDSTTKFFATSADENNYNKDHLNCYETSQGTILINKIVEGGDVPSSNWSFNILGDQGTVASDLHDGDSITLPTGTYTISESTIAGYVLSGVSGVCSDINSPNATLTITTEGGTCTLTNTQDPVPVRGFKYFDVDQNGSYDNDDYPLEGWTLCLIPDGNNQGYPISPSECQTTGADGFVEWTVPVGPAYDSDGFGAYHGLWMQENNQDGWTNTFPPNGGFNVDISFNQRGEVLYRYYDGESHYVDIPRFGNWQVPAGSVKVNKLIDADGDGEFEGDNNEANGLGFSWGLDAEEPFRAMGETADSVDAGDHTVSENEVESYHFVGWYYTNDDFGACEETTDDEGNELGPNGTTLPADFNVSDGETTEITLCNARNKGTITIDKVTNPEGDQTTFDINLIEAESIVHTSLLSDADIPDTYAVLAGTYNLEELSQSGWDLTDANCTVNGGDDFDPRTDSFNVNNGDEISCTFTNTKKGEITVIKYHDKNANGQKDEGEENLGGWNINLSDDESNSSSQATSGEGEDLGQASFNDLIPKTYTLSEDLQEGWTQSEITCDDNPSFIDGITAFFEGGHQVTVDPGQTVTCEIGNYQNAGQITGQKWNDENGDGRKCLLESPIADLGCEPGLPGWHIRLFEDNDGSIGSQVGNDELTNENGDFSFDSVNPGSYWLCEVNQAGWSQTYPNNDSQNPRCWEINLSSNGEINGRDFGNQQQQNPVLTISKINNKTGIDLSPGNDVTYTLTIEATQSAVKDVKVTDLLPSGFKYRGGSWTAALNGAPISIPEPVYASPGVWQVGDMNANDKIVLSYIADIDGGQQPGLYKDVAWAEGTSLNSDQVLANAIIPGKVDDNFVGTDINVVKETQSGVSVNIETKKTEEVLGASTSLPATGGNTIWIIIASMMLATGFSSMILGLRLKPKKRSKHV